MPATSPKEITVFYSWESDLPAKNNKIAIRSAITQAFTTIDEEKEDPEFRLILDEATNREPGSPNIPLTILNKISVADIFIADISIINPLALASDRKTPNPNVIFELGYAVALLGWERIILIFNSKFGNFKDDAPFDIDRQRAMFYSLDEDTENKKSVKSTLSSNIKLAISTIIAANPLRPSEKNKLSPSEEKRRRDITNLNWILGSIHFPTIMEQIEDGPKILNHRCFYFWEHFQSIFTTPLFHLYDTRALELLKELHLDWNVALSAGEPYYHMTQDDRSVFFNPGDMPLSEHQQKAWQTTETALLNLGETSKQLIQHIQDNYLEIDLSTLGKSAWSRYVKYYKDKAEFLSDID